MSVAASQAIYTQLNSHLGLLTLIAGNLHNTVLPQKPVLPAAVFSSVGTSRVGTLSDAGGAGVENLRIRVSSWGATHMDSLLVAEQVRLAMTTATTFEAVHIFETEQFEDAQKQYRVISDYSVWFHN